jgi:hypothetical protein
MKLSMRLTMNGLIRALRWRGVELREAVMQKEERDDERQPGIAEGGLSDFKR